eukprot:scaffold3084_cov82-Phaeocystis_antarctica.AAC.1
MTASRFSHNAAQCGVRVLFVVSSCSSSSCAPTRLRGTPPGTSRPRQACQSHDRAWPHSLARAPSAAPRPARQAPTLQSSWDPLGLVRDWVVAAARRACWWQWWLVIVDQRDALRTQLSELHLPKGSRRSACGVRGR